MPRAAIDTHMVDLVLPVVEMPQKFLELWRNAKNITLPSANNPQLQTITWVPERDAEVAEQRLHDILSQLRAGTGDFKHYKRATVLRRIERRMQVTAQPDLGAYYHYLRHTPEEATALLGDMLIGVTNFFRDREAFEALERDVVPQLVSAAGSAPQKKKFGFGQLVVPRERKPTVWRCRSTISYNWTGVRPPFNYLPPTSMSGPSA